MSHIQTKQLKEYNYFYGTAIASEMREKMIMFLHARKQQNSVLLPTLETQFSYTNQLNIIHLNYCLHKSSKSKYWIRQTKQQRYHYSSNVLLSNAKIDKSHAKEIQ